ncbi:MAG: DUF3187 family protein [Lentisphaerae bacterium]|nr:DUF3187 family protein [Lentisphaerota bacterium]
MLFFSHFKFRLAGKPILVFLTLALPLPLLFAGPAGSESTDNVGNGHLTAPSMSPGHILRPSALFLGQPCHPQGTWDTTFDAHWANLWGYDSQEYIIDGEWLRVNARVFYAVTDSIALGAFVPVMGRMSGFMDPMIDNFHRNLNMPSNHRVQYPNNRSRILLFGREGTHTIAEGDSWGLGDVGGGAVVRLTRGDGLLPALTLQAQGTLPTGDDHALEGLGEPSAALGALASKRLGHSPLLVFGGLGIFHSPADEFADIPFNETVYTGLVGVEYQVVPAFSLIAQYLNSSPIAKSYSYLSESSHEVSAGGKWRIAPSAILELAVEENVAVYNNSPDIGAHLALSLLF